ncbi:hypothetical protein MF271_14835 [Deinococcus sp. KNUC1210]|uniref:hypothetical protein n=1 Tax=Deinococcus sp. KNUC1210 TaxID=2917691 RepID=UPI001EF03D16|nr:hypothetical protein [Deinococcus sp. KNUC1210]ULH15211.1 hypothetical protein MF271_14835 [Deinococcus sp. KNUC1210]
MNTRSQETVGRCVVHTAFTHAPAAVHAAGATFWTAAETPLPTLQALGTGETNMDVIINNPPAQTYSTQGYAAPAPYGYAPGYQHHGPGLLLPLLLLGGFLFWRGKRRHQRRRQRFWAQNMPAAAGAASQPSSQAAQGQQGSSSPDDWRQNWQQGRERFFGGGGLFGNGSVTDRLLGDKALDIARERYARGEIDADQYAELQRNLSRENEA